MDNDKAFAIWTAALIGGGLALISVLVISGVTQLPAPLVAAEHVGVALLVRLAYKSFDTDRWTVFDLWDDVREHISDRDETPQLPTSGAADATA